MNPFADDIQAAIDAIAEDGESVKFQQAAAQLPNGQRWRDQRATAADPVAVKMLFFSPLDLSRGSGQFAMFSAGTDVVSYSEVGLLAGGQGVEPSVKDTIVRSSGVSEIVAVDKIAPNGIAILYYVAIK